MSGPTFGFSGETLNLLSKNGEFYRDASASAGEQGMGFSGQGNGTGTQIRALPTGEIEVTFSLLMDDNEEEKDGRIFIRDSFTFDPAKPDSSEIRHRRNYLPFNNQFDPNLWRTRLTSLRYGAPADPELAAKFGKEVARKLAAGIKVHQGSFDEKFIQKFQTLEGSAQALLTEIPAELSEVDENLSLALVSAQSNYSVVYRGDQVELTLSGAIYRGEDAEPKILVQNKIFLDAKTKKLLSYGREWQAVSGSEGDPQIQSDVDALNGKPSPSAANVAAFLNGMLPVLLGGGDSLNALGLPASLGLPEFPEDFVSPYVAQVKQKEQAPQAEARFQATREGLDLLEVVAQERASQWVDESKGWFSFKIPLNQGKEERLVKDILQQARASLKQDAPAGVLEVLAKLELKGDEKQIRDRLLSDAAVQKIHYIAQSTQLERRAQEYLKLARADFLNEDHLPGSALALADYAKKVAKNKDTQQVAERMLSVVEGKATLADKLDFILPQAIDHVFQPAGLAAMVAAGFAGPALELGLLSRLPASWGFAADGLAFTGAVVGEAATFTTVHKLGESMVHDPASLWTWESWWKETVSTAGLFAFMKLGHAAVGQFSKAMAEGRFGKWAVEGPKTIYVHHTDPKIVPELSGNDILLPIHGVVEREIVTTPIGRLVAPTPKLSLRAKALTGALNHVAGIGGMYLSGQASQALHLTPHGAGAAGDLTDATISYLQAMFGFKVANALTGGGLYEGIANLKFRQAIEQFRKAQAALPVPIPDGASAAAAKPEGSTPPEGMPAPAADGEVPFGASGGIAAIFNLPPGGKIGEHLPLGGRGAEPASVPPDTLEETAPPTAPETPAGRPSRTTPVDEDVPADQRPTIVPEFIPLTRENGVNDSGDRATPADIMNSDRVSPAEAEMEDRQTPTDGAIALTKNSSNPPTHTPAGDLKPLPTPEEVNEITVPSFEAPKNPWERFVHHLARKPLASLRLSLETLVRKHNDVVNSRKGWIDLAFEQQAQAEDHHGRWQETLGKLNKTLDELQTSAGKIEALEKTQQELEGQKAGWQNSNVGLDKRNRELIRLNQELESTNETLTAEKAELVAKAEDLETQLAEAQVEVEKKETEIQTTIARAGNAIQTAETLKGQVASLNSSLNQMRGHNELLQDLLSQKTAKSESDSEASQRFLNEKEESTQEAIQDFLKASQRADAEITRLQQEAGEARAELEVKNLELEEAVSTLTKLQEEYQAFKEGHEGAIEAITEQVQNAGGQLTQIHETFGEFDEKLLEKRSALEAAREVVSRLTTKIREMNVLEQQLEATGRALTEASTARDDAVKEFAQWMKTSQQITQKHVTEMAGLKKKLSDTDATLVAKTEELRLAQQNWDKQKSSQSDAFSSEKADLERRHAATVEEKDREIQTLKDNLVSLNRTKTELEGKIREHEAAIEGLNSERAEFDGKMAKAKADFGEQIKKIQAELEEAAANVAAKGGEIESLQAETAEQDRVIGERDGTIAELRTQVEAFEREQAEREQRILADNRSWLAGFSIDSNFAWKRPGLSLNSLAPQGVFGELMKGEISLDEEGRILEAQFVPVDISPAGEDEYSSWEAPSEGKIRVLKDGETLIYYDEPEDLNPKQQAVLAELAAEREEKLAQDPYTVDALLGTGMGPFVKDLAFAISDVLNAPRVGQGKLTLVEEHAEGKLTRRVYNDSPNGDDMILQRRNLMGLVRSGFYVGEIELNFKGERNEGKFDALSCRVQLADKTDPSLRREIGRALRFIGEWYARKVEGPDIPPPERPTSKKKDRAPAASAAKPGPTGAAHPGRKSKAIPPPPPRPSAPKTSPTGSKRAVPKEDSQVEEIEVEALEGPYEPTPQEARKLRMFPETPREDSTEDSQKTPIYTSALRFTADTTEPKNEGLSSKLPPVEIRRGNVGPNGSPTLRETITDYGEIAGITDEGRYYSGDGTNGDALIRAIGKEGLMIAVADGAGGMGQADQAAQVTLGTLGESHREGEFLQDSVHKANERVLEYQKELERKNPRSKDKPMATLAGVVIHPPLKQGEPFTGEFASVGDARMVVLRRDNGEWKWVFGTKAENMALLQAEYNGGSNPEGLSKELLAKTIRGGNVIINGVGYKEEISTHGTEKGTFDANLARFADLPDGRKVLELEVGDVVLGFSDGLNYGEIVQYLNRIRHATSVEEIVSLSHRTNHESLEQFHQAQEKIAGQVQEMLQAGSQQVSASQLKPFEPVPFEYQGKDLYLVEIYGKPTVISQPPDPNINHYARVEALNSLAMEKILRVPIQLDGNERYVDGEGRVYDEPEGGKIIDVLRYDNFSLVAFQLNPTTIKTKLQPAYKAPGGTTQRMAVSPTSSARSASPSPAPPPPNRSPSPPPPPRKGGPALPKIPPPPPSIGGNGEVGAIGSQAPETRKEGRRNVQVIPIHPHAHVNTAPPAEGKGRAPSPVPPPPPGAPRPSPVPPPLPASRSKSPPPPRVPLGSSTGPVLPPLPNGRRPSPVPPRPAGGSSLPNVPPPPAATGRPRAVPPPPPSQRSQTAQGPWQLGKGKAIMIGRGVGVAVQLNGGDTSVKENHAAIQERDGFWYLKNLAGANDTAVNQSPVESGKVQSLEDRSLIRVGSKYLNFHLQADGTAVLAPFYHFKFLPRQGHYILGRGPEAAYKVHDSKVSSKHARIYFEKGQWKLRDLNSRNKTFWNEQPIPGDLKDGLNLNNGNTIRLPGVTFLVRIQGEGENPELILEQALPKGEDVKQASPTHGAGESPFDFSSTNQVLVPADPEPFSVKPNGPRPEPMRTLMNVRPGYDEQRGILNLFGLKRYVFIDLGVMSKEPEGESRPSPEQMVFKFKRGVLETIKTITVRDKTLVEISRNEGTIRLKNQDFKEGVTVLRGTRLIEVKKGYDTDLKEGDEVQIGDFHFTFTPQ